MAVSYVLTPTLEKDGLDSLFAAYKGAYPPGTDITSFTRQLVAANGVPYSAAAIDNWVFSLSGKSYAKVTSGTPPNNPGSYGGATNRGWAYFAAGNLIKLPDFPRAGLPVPTPDPAPAAPPALRVPDQSAMLWVVGAGLALWLVVGVLGKKKSSKSSSSGGGTTITRWTT
jgi:hypothetical protein